MRIQEIVTLKWNDYARYLQNSRPGRRNPIVPNGPYSLWRRIRLPVLGQGRCVDPRNQIWIDADRKGSVVLQQWGRIDLNENLQGSKRLGLRQVDDRDAFRVPTAPEATRTFSIEGRSREPALDDSPSDDDQAKTPCSNLPIKSSTCRAPISVRAYVRGAL